MRLSVLVLALPAAAAAAAPGAPPLTGKCLNDPAAQAALRQAPVQPRKLGELPPGKVYLTVNRSVGKCHEPVIVRYGVGAAAPPAQRRR